MEPSARLTSSVTSMAPPGAANPGIGATSWAASTIALASSPSPPAGNCVGRAGSKPGCGPAPGAAWSAHETCGKPAAPWPPWPPWSGHETCGKPAAPWPPWLPWPNGGPPDGSGGGAYDCPAPAPYGWPPAGLNGWPYGGPPAAPYPPNAWLSA